MPEPTRARDAGDPVDVFADLNGTWKGTFTGYDEVGKELYRIQVQQVYRRKDGHTQTVQVTDTMPDGTVIRGDGENTAHPSKVAGAPLVLKCVVRKSNGEIVRHDGRLGTGPDGHEQLVWFSKEDGKTETFREWVEKGSDGKPTVYHIQGMGRYGDTSILMAGRYEKQVESEQAEKDSRGK